MVAWREIVAVCGMVAEIAASPACGVPATEASTVPAGAVSGMFAKSGGSWSAGTNCHGPWNVVAMNQRPEMTT